MTRIQAFSIISGLLLALLPAFVLDQTPMRPAMRPPDHMEKPIDTLSFSIAELTGHFEPGKHPDFVLIPAAYANKDNMYLRKAAFDAFLEMRRAALADGFELRILSATRNFDYQKLIWENKWTGKTPVEGKNLSLSIASAPARALKIMHYSAMPATSRHHWGSDIDLNALENSYFEQGKGKRLYEWLRQHAHTYGFCQPYSEKGPDRPEGYEEEKWHWSYLPLAKPMLEAYKRQVQPAAIKGFKGDQTVEALEVIPKYVLGIHADCQ